MLMVQMSYHVIFIIMYMHVHISIPCGVCTILYIIIVKYKDMHNIIMIFYRVSEVCYLYIHV